MVLEGYFEHDRPEVAALVPPGDWRVLDVGCGAGRLGKRLLDDHRAAAVDGIEQQSEAVAVAAQVLDDVVQLDLDAVAARRDLLGQREGRYDVVVVADVLEHLRDPWGALTDLVAVLRPGGWVVASVPNVRVFTVLLPLVRKGRFEYKEAGVLDRTHLRFFTRSSAIALVEGSGLAVESIERSVATWRRGWRSWVERHIGDFGNEQFLIRAVKK